MEDFVIFGRWLGIPFIETEEFERAPRHWRWLAAVAAAAAWSRIHVTWHADRDATSRTFFSASQVTRLLACTGGAYLLRVEDDDGQEAADAGTDAHRRVLLDDMARHADLQDVTKNWLWSWVHADIVGGGSQALATVEYARGLRSDGTVGHYGMLDTHRAYPAEVLIGGTEDCGAQCLSVDGEEWLLRVCDLKTGHEQLYAGALEPPGEAWQNRTNAVLKWIGLGRPAHVQVRLAWACWDDRESRGWIDEAPETYGAEHLRAWEATLWELWERVDKGHGRGSFRRGDHCRYCSSLEFCPAQRAALARLRDKIEGPLPTDEANLQRLSDEEINELWDDLQATSRIYDRAKSALTAIVERAGAVPCGPQYELYPQRNLVRRFKANGDKLNLLAAEHVMATTGDPTLAGVVRVTSEKFSLTTIEEGLKAVGVVAETFLSKLEADGVIVKQAAAPYIKRRKVRRAKPEAITAPARRRQITAAAETGEDEIP